MLCLVMYFSYLLNYKCEPGSFLLIIVRIDTLYIYVVYIHCIYTLYMYIYTMYNCLKKMLFSPLKSDFILFDFHD